jgi:diguanylate cyclase
MPAVRCRPLAVVVLLGCLLHAGPGLAVDIEGRVAELERHNVTAPWRESAELIEALVAESHALSPELRFRIDYLKARNLALAGHLDASSQAVEALLSAPDIGADLRLRAYTLGVNVAANTGDHERAFSRLAEALALSPQVTRSPAQLLAMASYLYLRVGETGQALRFADDALASIDEGDTRGHCTALEKYGAALTEIGDAPKAESVRRQQMRICDLAGDPVFAADARRGLGRALHAQGASAAALPWLRDALERFEHTGFLSGSIETRLWIADALIGSSGDRAEATALLQQVTPFFRERELWTNLDTALRLLAQLAEREGNIAQALAYEREARQATASSESQARERRTAFLQVQFATQQKEQEIALLASERELQQLELASRQRLLWLQAAGLVSLALAAGLLVLLLRRSSRDRRHYRELSEHDGLTGLLNHQHTRRLGQRMLNRCRRDEVPLTAVVADIDLFKQINDRFGHAAGDAVLRNLGALLREVFGERAVIGRTGGEEFTVLLAGDRQRTVALLDDLRQRIVPLAVFGKRIDYSLSFGLCEASMAHDTLEELLRGADSAMYQAKRSGRNQVVDAAALAEAARPEPGLVVVGTGIQLGRHLSQRCLSEILEADVVFGLTDAPAFANLLELRPDVIDLRRFYAEGKDRRQTYREMDDEIMGAVRSRRRVCAVFYGHPGVFADVPHMVVRKAREEGFRARMEPGISSEACLYADLGLDPGRHGVQSIEATQFLVEDRQIDNRSLVLLWQVALTGDLACSRFHAEPAELQKLVDRLLLDYPGEHEVILYEASHFAVEPFRAERLMLRDLPRARYQEYTMLAIPPRTDVYPLLANRFIESLREAGKPGAPAAASPPQQASQAEPPPA